MSKSTPHTRDKFLDGEFLFDYYWRVMGTARSQRTLPAVAKEHGMVNYLGKPASTMGCWKSMWRWACQAANHQKAYEIYSLGMADIGRYVTFDEFKVILREHSDVAVQFRNDGQRQRYWRKNKLI